MKKCLSYLSILFIGLNLSSCKNEVEFPKLTISELELLVPQKDSIVDLQNRSTVTFAWENSTIVSSYNLVFSTNSDLSDPVVVETSSNPYVIRSSEMNDLGKSLGLSTGSTNKIFWSVKSRKSSQPTTAEVNSFTLKMLLAQPLTPAKDSIINLNHDSLSTQLKFSWESMADINSYQLIISAKADLSNPLIDMSVSGTSTVITQQQFQNIIENTTNGLKRYKGNTIYWNVKAGDKFMANSAWKFKLYGTKIFTDIRGNESITYKVAVIPTADGTDEMVWMAENLRTRKLNNGVELVYDATGQMSWNSQYFTPAEAMISSTTAVPDELRATAGMYYRVQMIGNNSSAVVWPNLLVPAKWRVPEVQDFVNLANAALTACDYLEVLRAPAAYPALLVGAKTLVGSKMNLWGMNMAPSGTNRVASPGNLYLGEFGQVNGLHMTYAINSITQCNTLEINAATGKGNARAIGLGYNAPIVVRLIYKGDD
jgi:uncharacterized protein (DUF427 family)